MCSDVFKGFPIWLRCTLLQRIADRCHNGLAADRSPRNRIYLRVICCHDPAGNAAMGGIRESEVGVRQNCDGHDLAFLDNYFNL